MDKKKKEEDQIIEENILEETPVESNSTTVPEPDLEDQPEPTSTSNVAEANSTTVIIDGADTRSAHSINSG